jgi:hypothetical protein
MAGILLASGFCLLQTVLHFLQTLEKFRAGFKYDGAFRYSLALPDVDCSRQDYGEVFTDDGDQTGNQSSVKGLEQKRRHLASLSFREGPHWTLDVGVWGLITVLFAGLFHWQKHEGFSGAIWILVYCLGIIIITWGLVRYYERSTAERLTTVGKITLTGLVAGYCLDLLAQQFPIAYRVVLWSMSIAAVLLCGFGGYLTEWVERRRKAYDRRRV